MRFFLPRNVNDIHIIGQQNRHTVRAVPHKHQETTLQGGTAWSTPPTQ